MTEHPKAALVRRLYEAFRTRDRTTLAALATTTGQRAGRTHAGRYLLLMTIRRDRIAEPHLFHKDQAAFDAFWS